jgi:hypothetical protein
METSAIAAPPAAPAMVDTTIIAQGTTTQAYAQVAQRVLRCWFGADGPLKATHVFNAEAASPAEGGAAEIFLHERDTTMRDQRGSRAFRVSFATEVTGVRIGITNLKMTDPLAQLMVRDVETWARGGEGCQARALSPPQVAAPTQPPPAKKQRRTP